MTQASAGAIAAAIVFAVADPALAGPDACILSGGVATCEGDQSDGVAYVNDGAVVGIDLRTLTADIAPAAGVRGVVLISPTFLFIPGPALAIDSDASLRVVTMGDHAEGIFVSGVGGAGAVGGGGTFLSRDGGAGQSGRAGGAITIENHGAISTNGAISSAIDLGSEGGSGGVGGEAYYEDTPFGKVRYATGGAGGVGGAGGAISLINSGVLGAFGIGSHGVRAVSTGGAGVIGGFGLSNGSASGGGNGGAVLIANSGAVSTNGASASALFGRSQGGRGSNGTFGGSSGAAGGGASAVTIDNSAEIAAQGDSSYGIFGDSVGGRGGDGLFVSGFAVTGGSGAAGGSAAAVTIASSGVVTTTGADAFGVFGRSIGGGGGIGANAGGVIASSGSGGDGGHAGTVSVSVLAGGAVTTDGARAKGLYALSRGGAGGPGGNVGGLWADAAGGGAGGGAGAIMVGNAGTIVTGGEHAFGLHAESSGGPGGTGGLAGGGIVFGGEAGGGTRGGAVTVENSGSVTTTGQNALGILAQSIGGTGGDAGDGNGLIALGGSGNAAAQAACESNDLLCNHGGAVIVTNTGAVTTADATAIFAESIGGGGGSAGAATSFISIGGAGGVGGDGGEVQVGSSGMLTARGDDANAILAQSVGGGGGVGGDATVFGFSTQVGVGGRGGSGGDGGLVTVTASNSVSAEGLDSAAIFAQSVGGGGGIGGDASVTGITLLPIAVGGGGGGGGDGGAVNVVNGAHLAVAGDRSDGIFAQSVGGGGGDGGAAYAFGISPVVNIAISVGGFGGEGGDGRNVTVDNTGVIETWGDDSRGVFAQSVGGGGGTGGSSIATALSLSPTQSVAIAIAVGGNGGEGGVGGVVSVGNSNLIETLGDGSHGIQAQSIGGGGGAAGDAGAMAVAAGGKGAASLSIAVGGNGGSGNHGGVVQATNAGRIETYGEVSYGVFAQSVGGGGGEAGGGAANATEVNRRAGVVAGTGKKLVARAAQRLGLATKTATRADPTRAKSIAIGIGVGGYGGAGGDGAEASVINSGAIETWGYGSHGVFVQSVGGGGGVGGAGSEVTEKIPLSKGLELGGGIGGNGGSSGNGGAVTVTNTSSIVTRNSAAYGIFAQSVGGGGGVAGIGAADGGPMSADVSVGGNGGSSGDGGRVLIEQTGSIATSGNMSFGIFAQSVGGGGGVGGAGQANYLSKVTVGGGGGAAGNGGAVDIAFNGAITTGGAGAYGIFAQSVGGGGGVAGDVTGTPVEEFGITLYDRPVSGVLAIGQSGGGGGDGGRVVVNSQGMIITSGAGADGIVAQSVGGGGGIRGAYADGLAIRGSSGFLGSGNTVNVTHTGSISATGQNAAGIFAQSIGCRITETTDCAMPALPPFIPLEFLDALGLDVGGKAISVSVSGGTIMGGSGQGAGIELSNGALNTISIGADAMVGALSGVAIRTTSDDDAVVTTVNNAGTVVGDVSMTGGAPAFFNNLAGGQFRPNAVVDLNGGALVNAGGLAPGGTGAGAVVALDGNITQSDTGTLFIDVGYGVSPTDRIDATGDASIGGVISPRFVELMNQPTTILTTGGALSNAGATTDFLSVVLRFGLQYTPQALSIIPVANFAPAGLTANEAAIGGHFQEMWDAGGVAAFAPAIGVLAHMTEIGEYADALDRMHPEPYLTVLTGLTGWSSAFTDNMFSCHTTTDAYAPIAEEDCIWSELSIAEDRQDRTAANVGYEGDATRLQFGVQRGVAPNWMLGASVGYQDWSRDIDSRATMDGETLAAGIVAKYIDGPWAHAGAVTVAYDSFDAMRFGVGATGATATADSSALFAGLRARSAYLVESGSAYFKPYADLSLGYSRMDDFTESGAGVFNLVVEQEDQFVASIAPGFEAGLTTMLGAGIWMRPYISADVTLSSGDSWDIASRFEPAPAGAGFTTSSPSHDVVARMGAGAEFLSSGNFSARFQADHRIADGYSAWEGMAKIGWRF